MNNLDKARKLYSEVARGEGDYQEHDSSIERGISLTQAIARNLPETEDVMFSPSFISNGLHILYGEHDKKSVELIVSLRKFLSRRLGRENSGESGSERMPIWSVNAGDHVLLPCMMSEEFSEYYSLNTKETTADAPLNVDVLFVTNADVVGVPRSTTRVSCSFRPVRENHRFGRARILSAPPPLTCDFEFSGPAKIQEGSAFIVSSDEVTLGAGIVVSPEH